MNFKKSNKYHLHPMNYQTNPRNRFITNKDIRNLLAKLEIYDEIKDISIYQRALTHKSYINPNNFLSTNQNYINKSTKNNVPYQKKSNERLEFLGDSIIGHIICEYLYDRYPDKDEGFLTKLKTRLVDRKSLANFSKFIKISKYILISNHMENIHGRNTDKILEDVFEAFICALYKDLGFMITENSLLQFWKILLISQNYYISMLILKTDYYVFFKNKVGNRLIIHQVIQLVHLIKELLLCMLIELYMIKVMVIKKL